MGVGGSIFLIAVGAILTFGVRYEVSWLDLDVVGWVFMICGAVGLLVTLNFWRTRRRRTVVLEQHHHPSPDNPQRPTG